MPNNHSRCVQLQIERLENRDMLAANLLLNSYTGQLTIDGTAYADTARVSVSGASIKAELTYAGTTLTKLYPALLVRSVVFHGYQGNDRFDNAASKPATAFGGAGDDYLKGGNAYDKMFGGSGDDILIGNGAGDVLVGLAGNDRLYGGSGADKLYGGSGADLIDAGAGSNYQSETSSGVGLWVYVAEEWVRSNTITALAREIINFTNMEREKYGLAPLTLNLNLTQAAVYHADNMAAQEFMAHTLQRVEYGDLSSRLEWAGYSFYTAAENIAVNYQDAQTVVAAWMSSAGHQANILDTDYQEIGVGIGYGGTRQPYFCQVFGKPWR